MEPSEIAKQYDPIGLVGLGFMGRGIATCLLGYGFRVAGFDVAGEAQAGSREYIKQGTRELVEYADFDATLVDEWQERYQEAHCLDDLATCKFIIESVAENLDVKKNLFAKLEPIIRPDVVIASNTSALPITRLQEGLQVPERFLGMHWSEPAHATRFLELVPGELTSDIAMSTAVGLARACGKDPSVLATDIPGFIVNRLAYALYREALNLLQMGIADAATIDRSFRNTCGVWSTVFGPFEWIDLTGGPTLYAECMKRVLPTLANDREVPAKLAELSATGAQGIVDGHGFYRYTPETAKQMVSLFHRHAWKARELMNAYAPLENS
jgi:3-hydroxybutyryl-CoA dehydrogenase